MEQTSGISFQIEIFSKHLHFICKLVHWDYIVNFIYTYANFYHIFSWELVSLWSLAVWIEPQIFVGYADEGADLRSDRWSCQLAYVKGDDYQMSNRFDAWDTHNDQIHVDAQFTIF